MDDSGPLVMSDICQRYKDLTDWSHVLRLQSVRQKLTVERSGNNGDYIGKIGTRASKKTEQKAFIKAQKPELFDWIFTKPVGTTPSTDLNLTETKQVDCLLNKKMELYFLDMMYLQSTSQMDLLVSWTLQY